MNVNGLNKQFHSLCLESCFITCQLQDLTTWLSMVVRKIVNFTKTCVLNISVHLVVHLLKNICNFLLVYSISYLVVIACSNTLFKLSAVLTHGIAPSLRASLGPCHPHPSKRSHGPLLLVGPLGFSLVSLMDNAALLKPTKIYLKSTEWPAAILAYNSIKYSFSNVLPTGDLVTDVFCWESRPFPWRFRD